jgi:ribose 5-phosphate isomerase B
MEEACPMKFAIACDPAGVPLKEPIKETLKELGIEAVDFGINEGDPRDYPIFAVRAANAVISGECDRGIILCGTGVGISIAANKVKGIRCCCCSDAYSAKMSRAHNDANMLAMGGRVVAPEAAALIARTFLETPFSGVDRHEARIRMLEKVENGEDLE